MRLYLILIPLVFLFLYPVYYGYSLETSDLVFSGLYSLYPDEMFYYFALGPVQAEQGFLFSEDLFGRAPEGHYFINIIGNLTVLLSGLTGLSIVKSFILLRVFALVIFFTGFERLTALLIQNRWIQLFTILLVFLSAGLGELSHAFSIFSWEGSAPEMNNFIAGLSEYYLPFALAFFTVTFYFYIRWLRSGTTTQLMLSGLSLLSLGVFYIYSMLVALAVMGAHSLFLLWKEKTPRTFTLKSFLVLLLFSLPVIAFYIFIYMRIGEAGREEGWFAGPSILEFISTYFWFILPLVISIFLLRKTKVKEVQFLFVWLLVQFILTRIPHQILPFQIQSYVGISLPMALIVGVGLNQIFPDLKKGIRGVVVIGVAAVYLLLASRTNILFYNDLLTSIEQRVYPIFISNEEMEFYSWIKENTPMDSKLYIHKSKARVLAGITARKVFYDVVATHEIGDAEKLLLSLNELVQNSLALEAFRDNGIDYFVVDEQAQVAYLNSATLSYLDNQFELSYSSDIFRVYKID